jgi:hypothetical protein
MSPRRLLVPVLLAAALALGGAVPAAGQRGPATRTWSVRLTAPAQFDFTLAEVRLHAATGPVPRLSLGQGAGLYYVAGALVRRPPGGGRRALVLVVNRRPRGSLAADRLRIGLRVALARGLGAPVLRQVVDPLTRPAPGPHPPTLCGLTRGAAALAPGALRGVLRSGTAIPGLDTAGAVAEAYDVVCGLPHTASFVGAVSQGCPAGLVAGCCPPNAMCAAPPTGPPAPPPPPPPPPPPACPPCPPCLTAACPLGGASSARVRVCPPPPVAC